MRQLEELQQQFQGYVWRHVKSMLLGLMLLKEAKTLQALRYRKACPPSPARSTPIPDEWIQRVIQHPEREYIQTDGRIRRWARIEEMEGRYLRVILLADGETVHNAFFDRGFKP